MDPRNMKIVANWLRDSVFTDEMIRPRPDPPAAVRLPPMLRTARSLEISSGQIWQSREVIFLKQAKLLVQYEDDFAFQGTVRCYYPTYQALSDSELRGYFAWRSALRRGEVRKTSLSFAFLYIYELINLIGVDSPSEGYQKLVDFRDSYGSVDCGVLLHLNAWITDFVVYYDLDPALLHDLPQVRSDRFISVFDHLPEGPPETVMEAVRAFSGKYLERSKFYGKYAADFDAVVVGVLRKMSGHYAGRTKKSMADHFFGRREPFYAVPFESAVFGDPLKRRNFEFALDDQCSYCCENGLWSIWKRKFPLSPNKTLCALLKTVDSMMREAFGFRFPVKPEVNTKWIVKIIGDEIQALLADKKAAETNKITIDFAQLNQIRRDAEVTQERLIVDEELDAPEAAPAPPAAAPDLAPEAVPLPADVPLNPAEYRLVQCLLYGRGLDWVRAEGLLLSVLVDGVNDKLYDSFLDSVLDDQPQIIEDYIQDLKEMVLP